MTQKHAPAKNFFKLFLGAEAVEAGDEEPGARHVTVDRELSCGGRRTAADAVHDELRQRTATIGVRRPQLSRRHQRRWTLQLIAVQIINRCQFDFI